MAITFYEDLTENSEQIEFLCVVFGKKKNVIFLLFSNNEIKNTNDSKQWAAVKTQFLSIKVPPHKWLSDTPPWNFIFNEVIHGQDPGLASLPPTILCDIGGTAWIPHSPESTFRLFYQFFFVHYINCVT